MSDEPRFITLEGGEGVGKSTQVNALHAALAERGIHCEITREPGGSEGAEAIRSLLLRGDDSRWSAEAEALLFAAARADHVEKTIRAALEQGHWVLSDRFLDSSLAYQGGARARERDNEESDRIGGRPESYHQKVDLAFRLIAAEEPERVRIIDASGTAEEVTQRLLDNLSDLF